MVVEYPRASQIDTERSRVREQQLRNVFSALTRAASLNREAAEEIACRTLRRHPHLWRNALGVAIAQGGPFVRALEDLINSGVDLPFEDILEEISPGDDALRRVALAATNCLVTSAQPGTEEQLSWQILLTKRLLEMGEWAKALTSAEKALEVCRVLSEGSPSAYAVQFAEALTLLGRARYKLGANVEAEYAVREAVKLYRELAKSESSVTNVKLVDALFELASILRANGDQGEALDVMREALRFRWSMNGNLSVSQMDDEIGDSVDRVPLEGDTEQMAEVLKHARDGVQSYRVLAEASPAAYTPDLAMSLNNLASFLSAVGERNGALEAAREAVELYRGLAEASPTAYTPDLAMSLNNLAAFLSEVGDRNEALVAAREAVRLRRALAEASPQANTPRLAGSLNNLANYLSAVGDREGALGAAREAVELYRALAEASPAAYAPDLAMSLNNLANILSAVGDREGALGAAREAVELYRGPAETSPAAYTPRLAGSLNNLADILSADGRSEEAQAVFVEGIDRFSPGVRACRLVARATWRDDGGEAGDVVAAAREADSTDDPVFLGPVRRMIARVITDAGISDTGLPRWATVDAESATSRIEGWLECEDSEQRGAFLEAQWSSPSASEREALAALAELYVDRPSVAALAALVERIADEGIQAVTTDLRIQYRSQLLARDWYEAHVSGRGASFLREHTRGNLDASRGEDQISEGGKQESEEWEKDLGDPDMRTRVLQVLAAMLPEAEAVGMMSVLALAELTDPRTAYDAHGSDEGAEDTLRELLEARNWRAMILVLGVRPSVAESTYGRIARLLSAAVNDELVERLRELYEHANEEMDAIHRRQLQALLDKALGTDQSPKSFSDLLLWVKE